MSAREMLILSYLVYLLVWPTSPVSFALFTRRTLVIQIFFSGFRCPSRHLRILFDLNHLSLALDHALRDSIFSLYYIPDIYDTLYSLLPRDNQRDDLLEMPTTPNLFKGHLSERLRNHFLATKPRSRHPPAYLAPGVYWYATLSVRMITDAYTFVDIPYYTSRRWSL